MSFYTLLLYNALCILFIIFVGRQINNFYFFLILGTTKLNEEEIFINLFDCSSDA